MMNPVEKTRLEAGLSCKELALVSGASYSLIGAYVQGRVQNMSNEFAAGLRKAGLNVDPEDYADWMEKEREAVLA